MSRTGQDMTTETVIRGRIVIGICVITLRRGTGGPISTAFSRKEALSIEGVIATVTGSAYYVSARFRNPATATDSWPSRSLALPRRR